MHYLKKRDVHAICWCVCTLCIFHFFSNEASAENIRADRVQETKDYNIVLVITSLVRADHLGCYGYERNTSPALDVFAEEACVFTNGFSQVGYTLPSMMSIMTSLYPDSHGVFHAFKDKLSTCITTLGEALHAHGYRTLWATALHDPHLGLDIGFERGYDDFININEDMHGRRDVFRWLGKHKKEKFFVAISVRHAHPPLFPIKRYKKKFYAGNGHGIIEEREAFERARYLTIVRDFHDEGTSLHKFFIHNDYGDNDDLFNGIFSKKKMRIIEKRIPFDIRISLYRARSSVYYQSIDGNNTDAVNDYIALYDASILGVDQEFIKPLLRTLEREKIAEKTIVIIMSDHGEMLGERSMLGHGFRLDDELLHVPLIMKIPGVSGRVISELTQTIDVMPTILSLAGIPQPFHVQGKSLVPLLFDESGAPVYEWVYAQSPIRMAMRSHTWKLILSKQRNNARHLFDLTNDPGEYQNVYEQYPELADTLVKHLQAMADLMPVYIDEEYEFRTDIDKKMRERIKRTGYW